MNALAYFRVITATLPSTAFLRPYPSSRPYPAPTSATLSVPEAGHMMMFQKGRQKLQRTVIDFLNE
ncbi:MAG: hypothetical protein KGK17_06670 [Betaproteobacteria bacterium]|nr:hypothetical protein [Betaproteobacteria bacterium]